MQSDRPFTRLKINVKPRDRTCAFSLKELALRGVALAHNGLFSPTDREVAVLMAIKNRADELAEAIKTDIEVLLQHIAYGEPAEAEKMIAESPELLKMSGDVVDYSLRKIINVTPAQLAFGGDDEQMCAMLKEKLGAEEFARQVGAMFHEDPAAGHGILEEYADFMNKLVAEISNPNANIDDELNHVENDSPLRNLLDSFRIKFAPGEVLGGKHFNPQFLLKAFEIYDTNYSRWGRARCRLFWSQVVGYLERLLPVSYVQAICQGIDNVVKGESLKRQLKIADNAVYFPLDASLENRLGYDHGIYIAGRGGWLEWRGIGPRSLAWGNFQNLCRAKTSDLQNLCGRIEKRRRLGV